MTDEDHDDWTLLSAYHDGELPATDAARLAARLKREPELRAALEEISAISTQLKALRPRSDAVNKTTPPRRQRALLLAASLAAAIALASVFWTGAPSRSPDAAAWHAAFLDRTYGLAEALDPSNVASFGTGVVPDLAPAGLSLVDREAGPSGIEAFHYAGANGCRLSVVTGPDVRLGDLPADGLSLEWRISGRDYAVVANGMDRDRFGAVAAFLETFTRQAATDDLVMAMRAATGTAARCV